LLLKEAVRQVSFLEIPNIYAGDYRKLLIVPLSLLALAVLLIFAVGIPQGIELKGGVLVTLQASGAVNENAIEASLASAGMRDASVRVYSNPVGEVVEVEIGQDARLSEVEKQLPSFNAKVRAAEDAELELSYAQEQERIDGTPASQAKAQDAQAKFEKADAGMRASAQDILAKLGIADAAQAVAAAKDSRVLSKVVDDSFASAKEAHRKTIIDAIGSSVQYSSYSFRDVSPTLSAYFLSKAVWIFIFSSILVAATVFVIFRTVVPALAVLAGAGSDILIAMGAMALFQIPLTLASFAALLMIVGFSLDTHILLTVRTLKRGEGTPRERIFDTMKTGATMSLTALTAFGTLFLLALVTHIPTYYQISSVAIFGLFGDIVAAWGLNAIIVLWYAERKERQV
jgi:preprotein translocase subunit SecF